jgi:hypothetical protein
MSANNWPDFGMHETEHQGVKLTCRYAAPGLTMQDLMEIFHKAHDDPSNSHYAGNPSKWPDNAGVIAVLDAVYGAIRDRGLSIQGDDGMVMVPIDFLRLVDRAINHEDGLPIHEYAEMLRGLQAALTEENGK